MQNENNKPEVTDVVPVEKPEMEITQLLAEEDPEIALQRLEKIAELAPRFEAALRKLLIACTFPADWEVFGEGEKAKACLSSHGTMRVGKHFGFQIFETQSKKEEWTDTVGKAYRYVYTCKAALGGRIVSAQGIYGSRDEFLGKARGEYRSIEDINEADIANAAHSIMQGNAVKALLGLKNIPADEYKKLMAGTGQKVETTGQHSYAKGAQGGTSADDTAKQQELSQILIGLANNGKVITCDEQGKKSLDDAFDTSEPIETAKASCKALTSFMGKDNKFVEGIDSIKALKDKRLAIALQNAKLLTSEEKKNE